LFHSAFIRLFLILFPLSLLIVAIYLNSHLSVSSRYSKLSKSQCIFYLGLSFVPFKKTQSSRIANKNLVLWHSTVLSKNFFTQNLKNFENDLKIIKNIIFSFPLALTKDKKWIFSYDTFLILPHGERKELSHLTYLEIEKIHQNIMGHHFVLLQLEHVFSYLLDRNFLFYLKGYHRENIIKTLDSIRNKTKGTIYISSFDEKLLRDLEMMDVKWKILYPFKPLLRFQILSWLGSLWIELPGDGFIIPSQISLSEKTLLSLKSQNKLIFLEQDSHFENHNEALFQHAHALISSNPQKDWSIIREKNPCLIKK